MRLCNELSLPSLPTHVALAFRLQGYADGVFPSESIYKNARGFLPMCEAKRSTRKHEPISDILDTCCDVMHHFETLCLNPRSGRV